ncbi:MAG: energy-coupling factor transporter transmembrane component T [Oscillospiraceae bacterium]|nr:energy-coupling factor transporter transmembrane component T [Oscillospiraceae bacterium]
MPEWLLQSENYAPISDKDTFVNKSILSFLSLLSRVRAQSGYEEDRLFVSPVFKLVFTLLYIVLLSVSQSSAFIYMMIVYIALVLCALPGKDIIKVLRGSIVAAVFTLIIMLPALFAGNMYSFTMIPVKVFATITAVNIMSYSTRWDRLIGALKRFHCPDLFIFVFDITIKYIVMLGEFSLEMLYALKLRSVGKNKRKYASLGGIGGTLFIKSKEMSEEMYSAMECRGFTGEYKIRDRFRIRPADCIYILINAGIVYTFIYFQRLAG